VELPEIKRWGAKRAKPTAFASALREGSLIYLDADAIVLEGLGEIWGGTAISGCADDLAYCPFIPDKARPWTGDQSIINRCYINSGAFFAPAERYPFFEHLRIASLDDDTWRRYTLDGYLYDNHFLCAFLNLCDEPVRILDPEVYGWRGFLKDGYLQVGRSGSHLVNRLSGKTLKLILFAGVQQTPEMLRSLPLDISTLVFERISGTAATPEAAMADLYASLSPHLLSPPADVYVNDILRSLLAEIPRLARTYTGQENLRNRPSYFADADAIRSIAFANPDPEVTWNGLRCGGAYIDAQEYSQIRALVRALNIKKVFETGAGETSILFRSLDIETYSLEYQQGPWVQRAAQHGSTCILLPFDHQQRRFVDSQLCDRMTALSLSDIDLLFVDSPVGTQNRRNVVSQLLTYLKPRFILYHDAFRDAVNIFRDQAVYGWKLVHFFDTPRGLALLAVSPDAAYVSLPDTFDPTTVVSQRRASVTVLQPSASALKPAQRSVVPIRLQNTSDSILSSRYKNPVLIAYHWFTRDGALVTWDGLRTRLPFDLEPGDTADFPVNALAPDREGEYSLQMAVVQEGVAWFDSSSPEASTDVVVRS
jgi:hypothetical protein